MQYGTTRSNEIYTGLHALNPGAAPDGGLFLPWQLPVFTPEAIGAFAMKNPNQAVAEILNLFFDTELTRWDVDFAVGRHPVRLRSMVRRITICEFWHNLDWDFPRTVRDLAALARGSRDTTMEVGQWGQIAIRIGFLFGIFGELMRDGIAALDKTVDIAVPSGDLSSFLSCWYGRAMGLPIGSIIICCNENNNLWNLIRQGEIRTGIPVKRTCTPNCDHVAPANLEYLIHSCGGREEAIAFATAREQGRAYFPAEATLQTMQQGIYVSVISQSRVEGTIPTTYQNHNYVFGPYSALCHAGLSDYRAGTGASGHALILSDRGALCDDGFVAREMGIAVQTLHNML